VQDGKIPLLSWSLLYVVRHGSEFGEEGGWRGLNVRDASGQARSIVDVVAGMVDWIER
jgi:hypothetical protein